MLCHPREYVDGNLLLQVEILELLLDYSSHLDFNTQSVTLLGCCCAVGFWCGGAISVFSLRRVSVLAIMLQGFIFCAISFFICLVLKSRADPAVYWLYVIIPYVASFVFSGYGPAPAVYLLPSLLFPAPVRASVNGTAAAIAKVGAIIGVLIGISDDLHICSKLAVFGGAALVGAGATISMIQAHITQKMDFSDSMVYLRLKEAQARQRQRQTNISIKPTLAKFLDDDDDNNSRKGKRASNSGGGYGSGGGGGGGSYHNYNYSHSERSRLLDDLQSDDGN
jgi:uncharacterized membrane protein YgcG